MSPVLVAMTLLPGDQMSGTKALHLLVYAWTLLRNLRALAWVAEDSGLW